jgi:hypothetical protein
LTTRGTEDARAHDESSPAAALRPSPRYAPRFPCDRYVTEARLPWRETEEAAHARAEAERRATRE